VSIGIFPDTSGKVGSPEVLRCTNCGHGVTIPPLADVAFLYADRQSQDYQPDARGLSARIKELAFRRQARKLLRQLPERPRSVLDFGCGSGQFTRIIAELLPDSRVVGSDFHETAPPELKTQPYLSISELPPLAGSYDLVMAMHVLEHEDDTQGLLSRIAAMVRPGGTLLIEVPNVDCIWSRLLGKKWDAWYVPYHRTHFTRASLRHRLGVAGFTVLAMHGVTVPTMGRTLANFFGRKNNFFWLVAGIALHPVQWLGEKFSGQPSAIRAILRV
jgi:SAM-dependent methyltransferase